MADRTFVLKRVDLRVWPRFSNFEEQKNQITDFFRK